MKNLKTILSLASLIGLYANGAFAADMPIVVPLPQLSSPPGLYVHVGPGSLLLSESANINAGGAALQGANISVPSQSSLLLETGYFLTPNIAVSFTGGIPPLAKIYGAGTIGALGKLGSILYGPTALTAHYHFTGFGALQPYIGGGPLYMIVFKTNDAALSQVKVENAFGFVAQIGADYMINEHWGAFFDVKKSYLRTKASGMLGATPIQAKVKMDPLVFHTGLTYRF